MTLSPPNIPQTPADEIKELKQRNAAQTNMLKQLRATAAASTTVETRSLIKGAKSMARAIYDCLSAEDCGLSWDAFETKAIKAWEDHKF